MEEHELLWGIPVIGYLFLAGLGAGALVTSASLLLRGGKDDAHFALARYGAFLSLPTVGIGTGLLVLELGSFEVGNWFKFLNLYTTITLSPMSIGSWLLLVYFGIAGIYALTFISPSASHEDDQAALRQKMAYLSLVVGVGVAVYTGILLGAMPARPLWNSPILAMLFLVSAISTGIASVLLTDWLMNKFGFSQITDRNSHSDACYLLASTDTIFIAFELMIIFLFFMYAHLTVGDSRSAIAVIEFGGALSGQFWIGVVLLGLVVPALLELIKVLPRLLKTGNYTHTGIAVFAVPILVLVGGYLLRYVIVAGGQIAQLSGI